MRPAFALLVLSLLVSDLYAQAPTTPDFSGKMSFEGPVRTLAYYQGRLIAAGAFYESRGQSVEGCVQLIDGTWQKLSGCTYGSDAEIVNGKLWMKTTQGIVRWDGSSWETMLPVITGLGSIVSSGTKLYAAGSFDRFAPPNATGLAIWDGTSWIAGPTGLHTNINDLVVDEAGNLYASGEIITPSHDKLNGISWYNGAKWILLHESPLPLPWKLALLDGALYATGSDGTIRKWNGSNWTILAGTAFFGGRVVQYGSDLVTLGTTYTKAHLGPIVHAYRWTGSEWVPFGTSFEGSITGLVVLNGELYTLGEGILANGAPGRGVFRWNGTEWEGVDPGDSGGANAPVKAFCNDGTSLWAGGDFTRIGGVPARHIARWDGNTWHAIGEGTDGTVYSLACRPGLVVAGGNFATVDDVEANGIATWNGSTWSSLGAGMDDLVSGVALGTTRLFATGLFRTAGESSGKGFAVWDGTGWSTPTTSFSVENRPIASVGNDFYLLDSPHLYRFRDNTWCEIDLPAGTTGTYDLTSWESKLYVSGNFPYESWARASIAIYEQEQWHTPYYDAEDTAGPLQPLWADKTAFYALRPDGSLVVALGEWFYVSWKPTNNTSIPHAIALGPEYGLWMGGDFQSRNGVDAENLYRIAVIYLVSAEDPSIHQENSGILSLYPNPASSELVVNLSSLSEPFVIEVFDLLGRRVLRQEGTGAGDAQVRVSVRDLSAGTYIARLRCGSLSDARVFTVVH